MSMLSTLVESMLKKYSPVENGKPRPLTEKELKDLLEALKPLLEGVAEFASKHDITVQTPGYVVEFKGRRVHLSVERV